MSTVLLLKQLREVLLILLIHLLIIRNNFTVVLYRIEFLPITPYLYFK